MRAAHLLLLSLCLLWMDCASRNEILAFQQDLQEIKQHLTQVDGSMEQGFSQQDSLLLGRVEFLKERLRETETVLRRLKADQMQSTDDLVGLLKEVRSTLEDAGATNRRLQQKLDELNLILARQGLRQERDSLLDADPQWLFNQANLDRMRGLPELARAGFREYLGRFPEGEMRSWCSYWIADTWLSEQQMDSAFVEYNRFEASFPEHEKHEAAKLRRARILLAKQQQDAARDLLNAIAGQKGESPEQMMAREMLQELGAPE